MTKEFTRPSSSNVSIGDYLVGTSLRSESDVPLGLKRITEIHEERFRVGEGVFKDFRRYESAIILTAGGDYLIGSNISVRD